MSTRQRFNRLFRSAGMRRAYLIGLLVFFTIAYLFFPGAGQTGGGGVPESTGHQFAPFSLFGDTRYTEMERMALFAVLGIAIAGLLYALLLVRQVVRADRGTPKMQEVASAIREGANAYMGVQFKRIGPLIVLITILLFLTSSGMESPCE